MNSRTKIQKRFFIHTLGCKVNQYESQAMREILLRAGFKECISKEMADIYILNTCTVTHHADKESRYWLGLFHKTNPKGKIVVTGCYVEKDADNIAFLPGIKHIIKNKDKARIVDILNAAREHRQHAARKQQEQLSITGFKDHTKAFVKIQDGCGNSCSYCKVPLVRGSPESKPIDDIRREVEGLVENGFKEVVLTGICLGAWGEDLFPAAAAREVGLGEADLVDVLKALGRIKGDFRIRLSSIEPKYVTDELVEFIAADKSICKHLHIPLQSGDDGILKKMNRPYTAKVYKALIDRIKTRIKDAAVTTDVLVGFPGETDANFRNTVNFLKEILPARTHIFTFSKRKGTPAYSMGEEVNIDIVKKRYRELDVTAMGSSYLYRYDFLNRALSVLVETRRAKYSGRLTGYSDNYIKVQFDGPDDLAGKVVPVRIKEVSLLYTIGVYDGQ